MRIENKKQEEQGRGDANAIHLALKIVTEVLMKFFLVFCRCGSIFFDNCRFRDYKSFSDHDL